MHILQVKTLLQVLQILLKPLILRQLKALHIVHLHKFKQHRLLHIQILLFQRLINNLSHFHDSHWVRLHHLLNDLCSLKWNDHHGVAVGVAGVLLVLDLAERAEVMNFSEGFDLGQSG